MFRSLFVHPFTRELRENAKLLEPSEQTRQRIFGTVVAATGVAASASVASALAKSVQAARAAFVRTSVSIAATTVGVAVMSVAGVSMALPPSIDAAYIVAQDWSLATIAVDTSSVIQPDSVIVSLEGGSAWVAEHTGSGSYEVRVPQNGNYLVQVVGQGGQLVTDNVRVQGLDDSIPVMRRYVVAGQGVRLYFTDEHSGVDWNSISAVGTDGSRVDPLEINPDEGYVEFALTQPQMEVLVQDLAGNRAACTVRVD